MGIGASLLALVNDIASLQRELAAARARIAELEGAAHPAVSSAIQSDPAPSSASRLEQAPFRNPSGAEREAATAEWAARMARMRAEIREPLPRYVRRNGRARDASFDWWPPEDADASDFVVTRLERGKVHEQAAELNAKLDAWREAQQERRSPAPAGEVAEPESVTADQEQDDCREPDPGEADIAAWKALGKPKPKPEPATCTVDLSRAPMPAEDLGKSLGIVSRPPPGSRASATVFIPPADAAAAGFPRMTLSKEHPDRDLAQAQQWIADWRAGKAEPPRIEA